MKLLCKCLLTVGLAALLAAPALAQGRRGGRGPGGFNLLENKSVQEELKLTKEQIDKSKALAEEVRKTHDEDFKKIREMSDEDRRDLMKKVNDETMKGLAGILKEDQLKRYKQIQLQQQSRMGPNVLLNPDVEKELKLTDDQKSKIKTIAEDTQKEARALREGGGQPGPETFQKMQAISKEGMEKASATLTDDQKKTWKSLTGEPFEMKFDGPPRRQANPGDK